jgi:hypothetical protein
MFQLMVSSYPLHVAMVGNRAGSVQLAYGA